MALYLTDKGICLRVTDFSETSQIGVLLTARHGLIPLIAKGSKRPPRKGSVIAPLDLLTEGEAVFLPAKAHAELATLTAWELTHPRRDLRENLAALYAGMVAAEVTLALIHAGDPQVDPQGQPSEGLFDEFRALLDLASGPQRTRALVGFLKHLLTVAGYQPHLRSCVLCQTPPTGEMTRFDPAAGGILCGSCPTSHRTEWLSTRLIIALERLAAPTALQATPPERPADAAALLQAARLLMDQIQRHSEHPLRTQSLLPRIIAGAIAGA